MKDKVIAIGKPKRVNKSPWEHKIKRWTEDAQEEINGTKEPISNKKAQSNMSINLVTTLSHWERNTQQA